jgi:hypothetical protein
VLAVGKALSDWAAENGTPLETGTGSPLDLFLHGVMPVASSALLGEPYNFDQYGPDGLSNFYDVLHGDKTMGNLLTGVNGDSVLGLAWAIGGNAGGFLATIGDFWDPKSGASLTQDDLLRPLREISSVDRLLTAWQIMNTQKWMSKTGSLLSNNATFQEALVNLMTGMTPQTIDDAYTKLGASMKVQDFQKESEKEIKKLLNQSNYYASIGDVDSLNSAYTRAYSLGVRAGIQPKDWSKIVRSSAQESDINQTSESVYGKFLEKNNNKLPPLN